jgi:hypothetical protein
VAKEPTITELTAAVIIAAQPRWSRKSLAKVMREARRFDDFNAEVDGVGSGSKSLVALGRRLRKAR